MTTKPDCESLVPWD